jgi:hypothetical protein
MENDAYPGNHLATPETYILQLTLESILHENKEFM